MATKYTSDISDLCLTEFKTLCRDRLKCAPLDLASVLYAESGWYANAHNKSGDASGIFQAMPSTLKGIGFAPDAQDDTRDDLFRGLTARDQLKWLVRYYAPYVGKMTDVGMIYLCTFLPALLGEVSKLPDSGRAGHVLVAKGGKLGWVYAQNAGFDANKNYCIEFGELQQAVVRNCKGLRWSELVDRLTDSAIIPQPAPSGPLNDLRTALGLQQALLGLGFNPGPLDGIYGAKTWAAVVAFQKAHGLTVDGIVGPITRKAIQDAQAKRV